MGKSRFFRFSIHYIFAKENGTFLSPFLFAWMKINVCIKVICNECERKIQINILVPFIADHGVEWDTKNNKWDMKLKWRKNSHGSLYIYKESLK